MKWIKNRYMTDRNINTKKYFLLYVSISLSFVFSLLAGLYIYYDGAYFLFDSPLFTLRSIAPMTLLLEIVLPLSILMSCILASTWFPIFKAMLDRKRNAKAISKD